MTPVRWDARMWRRIRARYEGTPPATRILVAALLFVSFFASIAYVNVSTYLERAVRARSGSFGPNFVSPRPLFLAPPVTIRPPATIPDPSPAPAAVNRTHVAPPPDPTQAPSAPRARQPGAGQWRIISEQENKVRWIHGDRD